MTVAEPKVLELPKKLPIIRNLGKRWTETGRLSLGYTEVKGLFQRPRLEFDRLGWELFRGEESLGQPFNERLEESALSLGGLGEL